MNKKIIHQLDLTRNPPNFQSVQTDIQQLQQSQPYKEGHPSWGNGEFINLSNKSSSQLKFVYLSANNKTTSGVVQSIQSQTSKNTQNIKQYPSNTNYYNKRQNKNEKSDNETPKPETVGNLVVIDISGKERVSQIVQKQVMKKDRNKIAYYTQHGKSYQSRNLDSLQFQQAMENFSFQVSEIDKEQFRKNPQYNFVLFQFYKSNYLYQGIFKNIDIKQQLLETEPTGKILCFMITTHIHNHYSKALLFWNQYNQIMQIKEKYIYQLVQNLKVKINGLKKNRKKIKPYIKQFKHQLQNFKLIARQLGKQRVQKIQQDQIKQIEQRIVKFQQNHNKMKEKQYMQKTKDSKDSKQQCEWKNHQQTKRLQMLKKLDQIKDLQFWRQSYQSSEQVQNKQQNIKNLFSYLRKYRQISELTYKNFVSYKQKICNKNMTLKYHIKQLIK